MWTKPTETAAVKSIQNCFKADGPTVVERNTTYWSSSLSWFCMIQTKMYSHLSFGMAYALS